MAEKSTWREQTRVIAANRIINHTFNDTDPTLIILKNVGANDIFVNTTPQISSTIFEEMIPPQGTRILNRPIPYHEIFFLSVLGTTVRISSEEREFSPSVVMQTQLITIPSGSVEYTVPGTYTWTVPSGVSSVNVFMIGAGGGGGGGSGAAGLNNGSTGGVGGGGGAGGQAQMIRISVFPNTTINVNVGNGGAGGAGGAGGGWNAGGAGANGGNGGNSNLIYNLNNFLIFCGGGGGGVAGGRGSSGGIASNLFPLNGLNFPLSNSTAGSGNSTVTGGIGGTGGGILNLTSPFTLSTANTNGNFLSCGGGGGNGGNSILDGADRFGLPGIAGGRGSNGYISISW